MENKTFTVTLKSGNDVRFEYADDKTLSDNIGNIIMFGFQAVNEDGNNIFVPAHQVKYINLGQKDLGGRLIKTADVIKTNDFL